MCYYFKLVMYWLGFTCGAVFCLKANIFTTVTSVSIINNLHPHTSQKPNKSYTSKKVVKKMGIWWC